MELGVEGLDVHMKPTVERAKIVNQNKQQESILEFKTNKVSSFFKTGVANAAQPVLPP